MTDRSGLGLPWPPSDAAPPAQPGEASDLGALVGVVPLAPRVWIPAAAEEAFYRLNHLPPRLAALFDEVASTDPDEDDIEEIAPHARAMLTSHVLLDDWVDAFYDATRKLPDRLDVRRPGAAGRTASRGRPALLALRAVWAEAWSDEAVTARLRSTGSVALEARPTIVHAAGDVPAEPELARHVADALGAPREVRALPGGQVTRVAPVATRAGGRRGP